MLLINKLGTLLRQDKHVFPLTNNSEYYSLVERQRYVYHVLKMRKSSSVLNASFLTLATH